MVAAAASKDMTADVVHWWTSGSEAKSISVIAKAFETKGGGWKDSAVVGGSAARASAINRIMGGEPPAAMQWNLGVDLLNLADQGLLAPLDSVATSGKWGAVLPALITDKLTAGGHIIAVPVTVHADNWMFYNTKVFQQLGLKPPTTWDGFLADAPKIKAAGITPIALGGQPWQERVFFNSVLVGVAGKDAYRKLFVDKDAEFAKSETIVKALKTFKDLKAFVDEGSPGRNWNDATNMVITGKAAVQFMGDWAKGEFVAAGQTAGKEFGCAMAPGNQDAYILVVDTFAFPKNGGDKLTKAQVELANTIMDPTVQVALAKVKGSIPARTDVDLSGMDECVQLGRAVSSKPENQLPNFAMALSGDTMGSVHDALTKFWNDNSIDAVAASTLLSNAIRQSR
jgi:glucose/mannose transport system substrate-binding protein